jgi:hypothetical protein
MAVDRIGDGLALRSKGDIVSHDGTSPISISPGTNGQILYAQSSATAGVQWQTAPVAETQQYVLISTAVITANTRTVSFTSIPSTYKHLYLRGQVQGTEPVFDGVLDIRANSSTTIVFAYNRIYRDGSSTLSTVSTTDKHVRLGNIASSTLSSARIINPFECNIYSYANTSYYKEFDGYTGLLETNFAGGQAFITVGTIETTSAISSLQIMSNVSGTNELTSGSYISLYGIAG